jgi:hypothetical protein
MKRRIAETKNLRKKRQKRRQPMVECSLVALVVVGASFLNSSFRRFFVSANFRSGYSGEFFVSANRRQRFSAILRSAFLRFGALACSLKSRMPSFSRCFA